MKWSFLIIVTMGGGGQQTRAAGQVHSWPGANTASMAGLLPEDHSIAKPEILSCHPSVYGYDCPRTLTDNTAHRCSRSLNKMAQYSQCAYPHLHVYFSNSRFLTMPNSMWMLHKYLLHCSKEDIRSIQMKVTCPNLFWPTISWTDSCTPHGNGISRHRKLNEHGIFQKKLADQ